MARYSDLTLLIFNHDGHPPIDEVKYLISKGVLNDNDTAHSALVATVLTNNVELAEFLLDEGADVNAVGEKGQTALSIAVMWKNFEMVKLFVSRGANINHLDEKKKTAFERALNFDRDSKVSLFLIENGADVNLVGKTLFKDIVLTQTVDVFKASLQAGADFSLIEKKDLLSLSGYAKYKEGFAELIKNPFLAFDEKQSDYEYSFLSKMGLVKEKTDLEVIQSGDEKELLKRIEKGQLNAKTSKINGESLLYWAVRYKKKRLINRLLKKGALIEEPVKDRYADLLDFAIDQQMPDVVERMIQFGSKTSGKLSRAVRTGNLKTVQVLLKEGRDQYDVEIEALIVALQKKNMPIVKELISKGVDVNRPDSNGKTPLIASILAGSLWQVKYLMKKGADVFYKDKEGIDAFNHAMRQGFFEIAMFLKKEVLKHCKERQQDKKNGQVLSFILRKNVPFILHQENEKER